MKTESYKTEYVDNIPEKDDMAVGVAYRCATYKLVSLLCPCGCGREVVLPEAQSDFNYGPSWTVTENDGNLTLSPSIKSLGGCESHWFLRDGKVVWT